MTFPTSTTPTTNLDSAADNPSLARADLLQTVQSLNTIITEANGAGGVCVLDGSGQITTNRIPTTIAVTGTQIIQPSTGFVNIRDVLRLTAQPTSDIDLIVGMVAGDIAYSTDGDAGEACLAVYDGTLWRIVRFMTAIGGVQAAVTSSATLTATADV
jgi:hypothetical protein